MEFIKEADARVKAKEEKNRKADLVKKEVVKKLRNQERKSKNERKKIVTCLNHFEHKV